MSTMFSTPEKGKQKLLFHFVLLITLIILSCDKDEPEKDTCPSDNFHEVIDSRNFYMGFSTWSYGPDIEDVENTYQFIAQNADIYLEHLDNKIPWNAWINNTDLPSEFTNDMQYRVTQKITGHKLLLSVSLLNTDRNDLQEDFDGSIPSYSALNDLTIENAYFKHLEYLVNQFNPDYLVMAIEVNELKMHSPTKWEEYKLLMGNIRSRIRAAYPDLIISESITLHNWYKPDVENPTVFIADITNYVNQHNDFAAISFYPFFKGLHSKSDFQDAFDFLHSQTTKTIAFAETNNISEDLIIDNMNVNIPGSVCEQKDYLEVLLKNAYEKNYEFVTWWAHRDYDELWNLFPTDVKDIGKIWKDTGLLDENGMERPAYSTWKSVLSK